MTRAVAIIQARMGSTRLPDKVLMDLAGRTVLGWVVRAALAVPGIDDVVVATSTAAGDDRIAAWCERETVACFRGSESDVLSRFAGAARMARSDIVMRITADCPFFDPNVSGALLALLRRGGGDYAGNVDPATWPDGLDCEIVTRWALDAAAEEATRPSDREHVIPFIRNNRARFATRTLHCPLPGLAGERWTLDTPADLTFLRTVAPHLRADRPPGYLEVLALLDANPDWRKLNAGQVRDEGFANSIAAEAPRLDRSYARSHALLERTERVVPLASQTFSKSRIQYPAGAAPMFLTHGSGGRVWDVDGNEYVDLVNALLPVVLGYRDPDVDAAIRQQLDQGISFSLATELETALAERLVRHVPCAEMVRFGKNGTDATSAAVRLARAATGRDRILLCGYHGWQDWYIGATTRNRGIPQAVCELSQMVPFNDLAAIDAAFRSHPGEVAALIVEPAGVSVPKHEHLAAIREIVHRHGALLVFDEIVTGLRWSIGGAQARYGVTPDLAAFGKALGNGMPIAAVVGAGRYMRLMEEIFFSSTFGGEALSLAAAIAVVDKVEREAVPDRLWQIGEVVRDGAHARIAAAGLSDHIGLVGAAPWMVLTYREHATASAAAIKTLFLREMIAAGVLINASHNVCWAHSEADIARIFGAYEHACAVVRDALDSGDVLTRIGNQIINPVFSVRKAS
jgi:glutamate-1-semialdehyde aminotransferase/spore coat polysaccharide biosynthesis protein SpsF (cytidylyltransferase family)